MKKLLFTLMVLTSATTFAERVYYIKLKFTQSSFTLNLVQHWKDSANAFSITIPTTKKFYDSVKVNQELSSKFKTASFLINGRIGNRKIIVEDKFFKDESPIPPTGGRRVCRKKVRDED